MRAGYGFVAAVLCARGAFSQGLPDEFVPPGTTVATATAGDAARSNPGALPFLRASSLRFLHVDELRAGTTPHNGDALTFAAPLPLGLAVSVGASWVRPDATPTLLPPGPRVGSYGTGELGLAFALDRRLAVGLRWRLFGVQGADAASPVARLDGRGALDLGLVYRPAPAWSFGLVVRSAVGPREPAIGLDRVFAAGVGVRPTGTEALTLGADVAAAQDGAVWLRGGARVELPWVGALRGEARVDLESRSWLAALGIDLVWDRLSAGGGVFAGTGDALGWFAGAGFDGDRGRAIPAPGLVVTVPMESTPGARGLGRLLWRLERLRRDPAVRAVVFSPQEDVGGLAHAEELREAFVALRRSGVRVVCHLTDGSGSTYYACADADQISLDVAGGLRLLGLRAASYYLGATLWNLGVRTDFVRIGDWKSAPEQFTRASSTPPARAQQEQLLDDYFAILVRGVARSRGIAPAQARELVTGGPYTAREARARGLVDAVGTRESAQRIAQRLAGGGALVDLERYVPLRSRRWVSGSAVAVLYLDGDLVEGQSFEVPGLGLRLTGDRTIVEAIGAAVRDSRVGAIVVRVDSPGGSALASDVIWRALVLAGRRKPVVASFGRVAASGGYYLGSAAREIFADASCVTGSIGIFYGKADVARLLARIDVGVELRRRGEHADMESVFRPYTHEERELLAQKIGEFYGLFLARVAAGRGRTVEQIDDVGRGRVFSGVRARELGLVDRIGGLGAAIRRARVLAGLPEDHELIELPVEGGGILQTLSQLVTADATPSPLARILASGELRAPLRWLLAVALGAGQPLALADWPQEGP